MNWSRRDLAALDGLEPNEADGFQLAQGAQLLVPKTNIRGGMAPDQILEHQ